MKESKLQELIFQEENPKLDFKRDYELKKEKSEYVKDIIALANGNKNTIGKTAYLVFGIQEKLGSENQVFGIDIEKDSQKIQRELNSHINNHIEKPIQGLEVYDFQIALKKVLVIKVPCQDYVLILKKDLKGTPYKKGNLLYREGDNTLCKTEEYNCPLRKSFENTIENYQKVNKLKNLGQFEVIKKLDDNIYLNQKGNVKVTATLPIISDSKQSFSISCEIILRLESSVDVMFTLKEEDILEELFSGYISEVCRDSFSRAWILSYDEKVEQYTIDIASTVLNNISIEIVKTLSVILDDLQRIYAFQVNNMEQKLNSDRFRFSSKYSNGFELCRIDQKLWYDIQAFILGNNIIDYDFDNEWNIFGDNIYEIDVYDKVKVRFSYQLDENIYSNQLISTPKVIITWNTLSVSSLDIDNVIMTVNEAHEWFMYKLVPKVRDAEFKKYQKIVSQTKFFRKKMSNLKFDDSIYVDIDSFKDDLDVHPLIKLCSNLDSFPYRIHITPIILQDLYEGLILIFRQSNKFQTEYLHTKFCHIGNKNTIKLNLQDVSKYLNQEKSIENFIDIINLELREVKQGNLTIDELLGGYTLSHIFKCYYVVIKDNIHFYGESLIFDIYHKLNGVKEIYDVLNIRARRQGLV